jgi:hypothetical protein
MRLEGRADTRVALRSFEGSDKDVRTILVCNSMYHCIQILNEHHQDSLLAHEYEAVDVLHSA